MRFSFAFLCMVAASCAVPPESPAPESFSAVPPTASESDSERASLGDAATNPTPSESIGEAQEPIAWALVLKAACWVAGTLAAEYGCKKHILEDLCPPGTTITRTMRDTMDKNKTVTVTLPCDTLETMICGTAGLTAGEIMRQMCAGLL